MSTSQTLDYLGDLKSAFAQHYGFMRHVLGWGSFDSGIVARLVTDANSEPLTREQLEVMARSAGAGS